MIFKPAARYPADPRAVFVLIVASFSGLTAIAIEAEPRSLESLLPQWAVVLWGILLIMGSVTTLVGMTRQTLDGILIEQVGSVTVGVSAIFYSGVSLWVAGETALIASSIIFAWGLACLARWVQLQMLIVSAYHRQLKKEELNVIEAESAQDASREISRRDRAHFWHRDES